MVLLGGLLVLATWLALAIIVVSVGLVFVRPDGKWRAHDFVTASWWGLGILTLLAYLLSFFVPLRSATVAIAVVVVALGLGAIGWRRVVRSAVVAPRWTGLNAFFAATLTVAWIYLAIAVLGPVTHYDAGLYQWAATQYTGEFAVIPGLANLYGPLGYAGAEPVLGGLLQVTPWQGEGFRLLNGLFLILLGAEALSRMLSRPGRPGAAVAIAGVALVYPPMIWMADFWVASPTPDLPVLVVALVAAGYLTDLVASRGSENSARKAPNALAIIVVLAALMTVLRPTAGALAVGLVAVAVATVAHRRRVLMTPSVGASVILASALGAAVVARDRILSGWLQYPLSIYAFDVPWRAPDPEALRTATLGFARDPQNWQEAAQGWGWVGAWIGRLPQQWEPWWLLAALVTALILLAWSGRGNSRWRALAVVSAPFALAAALWWLLSPPALRFGWGSLFGLAAVLLGWGLWCSRLGAPATAAVAIGIAAVAVLGAFIRLDWSAPRDERTWLGIPYQVVPLSVPATTEISTDSGIPLRVPIETDQCWAVYPLCTPDPMPSLEFIGEGITSGFVS